MKNITLFNQVNLLQSFCKRMATATTSCAHSYKRYLLLTILLFVGVNNAWALNSTFTKGDVLFIYTDNGDAAWTSSACVKLWFNNDGTDKGVASTQWLSDYDDNHKLFYAIVPSDGANKVQLQRFASNCSTWWNACGDALQSSRQNDAYNTFYSTGAGNSDFGWKNETFEMYLYGAPNNWASSLGTFAHQGNGVYKYTYRYKTTATSLEFKLKDSKSKWHGNNVSATGLTVGKTYDLTGTVNLANGITLTMAKSVVSFPVTFASKGTFGSSKVTAKIGSTTLTSGKKYESGQKVVFTASPDNGYEIVGWYSDAACTSSLNNEKNTTYTINSLDADVQVYVKFTPKTYTVTLDNQGATTAGQASVTATYDAAMPSIADKLPAKTGYDFGGYWTEIDGKGTQYYYSTGKGARNWNIHENTTLYACWKPKTCTIKFNLNDGEGGETSDLTATYAQPMPTPITIPTRTGYKFSGYFDAKTDGNQYYNANGTSARNWDKENQTKTLYAHWTANTYYVHFDGNGSTSGSMVDQQFTYDKEQTLSKNNFSKEGCIFTGWNTAADGSGTSYTNQQRVSKLATEGTITLYARWSTSNCKWLETDIANIESGDEVVITMTTASGVTYALPSEKFTSGAPNATLVNVDGNSLELIRPQIVWIIYKNGDNLTFESNYNQGNYLAFTNSDTGVRVNDNTNRNFVVDDVSGYLMNTQTTDARYLGVHITKFTWYSYKTYSVNTGGQTLKLYKKVCLDENNYWVTWDADGGLFEDGKNTKIEHYQVGTEVTPPTPTHIGYNLTGWSPILEATMPAQNMTYTAQWELKTTTITLAHQGGTDGTESITATYSKPMPSITVPTRTGYNFQGYFSSNGGTGTKYYKADGTSANTWDQEAETFTLIAYWTAKTTTVSFNQNSGTGGQTSTVTATYDEAMPTPITVPTKEGHTFLGYYDATTDGIQYYDAAGNSTKDWNKEDAEITLYAQWKVNQYNVTWNPNEGNWHGSAASLVVSYDYGATISEPEDPVRGGWVFNGWDPIPVATMPAQDITYTAQWGKAYCENKYTFHTGTSGVWNNPITQGCFERKEGTETEWQIVDYVIPTGDDHTHFLVAYSGWPQIDQGSLGGHSKSVTSTWSETMYLAPAMNFESAANTPKVGHAAGAKGTLRIFDDSSWDNLCVGFIPDGYGITITGETVNASHAFHKTTTVNKWETDVIKLPGVTNHKYAMGLATEEEGTYVTCDHSKAAENIQKMGVTDKVVYLVVNDNWKADNARFAVCFMNSDKSVQTWVDMNKIQLQYAKDLYVATVPADQKYVIFCRMNGTSVENNWDNRWTQTSDIELPTNGLAIVCTISNWTEFTTTGATPQTQQNGKFRMWDNSDNKNWYVHFVPYYLLSYDKNGGEGEMAPTEYNTEDANNKVTVAANEFTRTGYDFVAWNTKADGTGTTYNPSDLFTMTADATIYAIWKAQDYQITYKDQGNEDYSGSNEAKLPKTHTYDKATELVNGEKIGYTFEGWYDNPDCTGDAITKLDAKGYTADITLYAKWTFAMEYTITNTETIFITSAVEQNIKATQPLILKVSNMPVGTTIDLSAGEHIHFYYANEEIKKLTNKYVDETFELEIVYKPEVPNTKEQPSITLNVLEHEKVIADLISCRSLPTTFAIVAKVGSMWYALPSQGLNSTDALIGYPVEVDNQDDPTEVTSVPENADWSLRQVYASSGVQDRHTANGHNLVFVNNEGTPKALNASVSSNYVLTDAQYANYYQTNPGLYEWTPTTTDLETYTLTNAQRTDRTLNVSINTVFGVHYDNKATTQVRFLPIQNRYMPAALQVVEWKENSVVIMYNGDPAQMASVSVNGAAVQNTTLSAAQRDIAVYELTATGLAANPTQQLSITIGTEKTILSIPYIINSVTTDATILPGTTVAARQEVAKVSDLVILKGATLTAAGAKGNPYKFRNVTIYGGGKLVVPADNGFGVTSLTLRIGGVTADRNYDYVYPEFVLNTQYDGAYTNTSGKINLDYVTTKDQYYTFVAPFAVQTKDIHYPVDIYGNNVAANNRGSFEFQYYDGAARAAGERGWKVVEEDLTNGATLTAHKGYTFYGMPQKVSVNGGISTRQKFGIHRIPMTETAANVMTHENDEQFVAISAHPSEKNINSGWNLIGNPYMSTITGLDNESIVTGSIVLVDNRWEWSNDETYNQRFIVFPSNDGEWYYTSQASNATLPAFKNFFVQIDNEANALSIPYTHRASGSAAPARRVAEDMDKDIELAIVLEQDDKYADQMDFLLNDAYSAVYDRNADFTKMMNNTNFNLFGVHLDDYLSFVAIDTHTARSSVAIGYQVPQAGQYTLRLSDKPYVMWSMVDAIYVTDHEVTPEVTTNLLDEAYTFQVSNAETNTTRFSISIVPSKESGGTTTAVDDILHQDIQTQKIIYNDQLYILQGGVVYDAMGQRVTSINK